MGIILRMFPPKIQHANSVRVIAPSCSMASMAWADDAYWARAEAQMASWGLHVTYGKHLRELDAFQSTTVAARLEDVHDAFRDPDVHLIHTVRGGWNVNQLLEHLDYGLISQHPKALCGFSDITALGNAIYAKTGLVTYSGPNYSQFGLGAQVQYTFDAFERCLMHEGPYRIEPSAQWTNDHYSADHPQLRFETNDGPWVLQEGDAEGVLLGGNLCTLNLLQGTAYMPDLTGSVVFLEDDSESSNLAFDRNLQSLLQLPSARGIRGVVIGRFQTANGMTRDLLAQLIRTKDALRGVPVIANMDFGHTYPMTTFPIGGKVRISAKKPQPILEILEH